MLRQLETKMDSTYSPIHHKLPPEVVCYIFQLCMPEPGLFSNDSDNNLSSTELPIPLILGAVCKTWKQIAWSTPHLWSIISVDANKVDLQEECCNVEESLRRSGQIPLSIRIIASDRDNFDYPWYYRLIEIINQHSTRWRVLDLRIPGRHWCLFSGNSQTSSILQVLRLDDTSHDLDEKEFHVCNATPSPAEVKINLRHVHFMSVDIKWDYVTRLELSGLQFDEWLNILQLANRLKYCRLKGLIEMEHISPPVNPYVHSSLQELVFDSRSDEDILLDEVNFPALRHFAWKEAFGILPISTISSLLRRSCCLLRELIITEVEFDEDDFIPFLQEIPSLSYLEFLPLSEQGYKPDHLFRLLSTTSMSNGSTSGDVFLPQLKVLKYTHPDIIDNISWRYIPGVFGKIDHLCDPQRRPLQTLQIRIMEGNLAYYSGFSYIKPSPLRRMHDILKAGLQLEIVFPEVERDRDLIKSSTQHHAVKARKRRRRRMQQSRYLI